MTAGSAAKVDSPENREYAIGLARAFAGAIIFSLPLLMTMEMWWLGFYLDRERLLLFSLINFLVLMGLSRVAGFHETENRLQDLLDAFAAYAVAAIASAATLFLFGILEPDMPLSEIAGKIAVQAIPASIGAMVANKQLGESGDGGSERPRWRDTYAGQLFLMVAGAVFLAFNVAPTEEMILIAYVMTPWHGIALLLVSILLLHAFVYSVGFSGQEEPHVRGMLATFLHYTLAGYGIAALVSLYVLWTFGRTTGVELPLVAMMVVVLGFPSAIGAAIARLLV